MVPLSEIMKKALPVGAFFVGAAQAGHGHKGNSTSTLTAAAAETVVPSLLLSEPFPDLNWTTDPTLGLPFIVKFPNATVAAKHEQSILNHSSSDTIRLKNWSNTTAVTVSLTYGGSAGQHVAAHLNDSKVHLPVLHPGNVLILGNFPMANGSDGRTYLSGRIAAFTGCHSNGTRCAGFQKFMEEGANPNVQGLTEWTWGVGPRGDKIGYDYSLVDGYNVPTLVTFGDYGNKTGKGEKLCRPVGCTAPEEDIKKFCPKHNLWTDTINGTVYTGCRSDCKLRGSNGECCVGTEHDPALCTPSSNFFSPICSEAYSWAYDDPNAYRQCDRDAGPMTVNFMLVTRAKWWQSDPAAAWIDTFLKAFNRTLDM